MNIVAIIPARNGSKGIPKKNVVNFCGTPLLAWTILQAKQSSYISEVYVSSDGNQILAVAEQYGAVAIVRPRELSDDEAASEAAILHALDWIENSGKVKIDWVVFLQATSPLREPGDIDAAIQKVLENNADSLLSVAILEDTCAFRLENDRLVGITYDPFKRDRRQDRAPIYHDNGSIYVFRPDVLRHYNNRLGGKVVIFRMPFWKSHEIDTTEDIDLCSFYFKKKNILGRMKEYSKSSRMTLENIELFVYDFDGVMTDNRALVLQDGSEGVFVNRSDGLAIDILKQYGTPQLILTTEKSTIVRARAEKLGLEVIDACQDKIRALKGYCENKKIDLQRTLYVGNDVNDFEAMKSVGFPITPADAHNKVKEISVMVTKACGGRGVIRELVDLLFEDNPQSY